MDQLNESFVVRDGKVSAEAVMKLAKEMFPNEKKLTSDHFEQAKQHILKNSKETCCEEKTVDDVEKWKEDVKAAHPEHSDKLKFKSKDQGKHISAEIDGVDRSFGVYDVQNEKGHVLHESFVDMVLNDKVVEAKALFTQMFEAKIAKCVDAKRKEVAKELFNKKS